MAERLTREQLLNLESSLNASAGSGIKFDALLHDPSLLTPEQVQNLLSDYYRRQAYPLDTGFDTLNLQSNTADNFTTVSGKISQWNDLSGSGRHAVQTTDANRPTLTGLNPTFDGSLSRMNLSSTFSSNTFSLYLVYKNNDTSTTKVPIGGGANKYIGATDALLNINNSGETSGVSSNYTLWGASFYQVISIRSNTSGTVVKCNGRTLYISSARVTSVVQAFATIGNYSPFTASNTYNWSGVIKAACIDSSYFDDATDNSVLDALYTRYALPETSNAIVGFGDSITLGTGATVPATGGWLPLLATAKSRSRKNYGIGGSRITAFDSTSGITRYSSQVIERPYSDTICILYGTNDSGALVSSDTYASALETVINGFISAGYSQSKIFVGTVPYKQGNANSALIAEYNTRITNICTALGLSAPADVYNSMLNGGGDTLLADTVHPNNSGHAIIRDAFAAIMP